MFELLLVELGERVALRPWNPAPNVWEEQADWWFQDDQEWVQFEATAHPFEVNCCDICGKHGGHWDERLGFD